MLFWLVKVAVLEIKVMPEAGLLGSVSMSGAGSGLEAGSSVEGDSEPDSSSWMSSRNSVAMLRVKL